MRCRWFALAAVAEPPTFRPPVPTAMSCPAPGSVDAASRKSFTSAQSFDHPAAYEVAVHRGGCGAYLRAQVLYSSLISEWRRLRAAAVVPATLRPPARSSGLTPWSSRALAAELSLARFPGRFDVPRVPRGSGSGSFRWNPPWNPPHQNRSPGCQLSLDPPVRVVVWAGRDARMSS